MCTCKDKTVDTIFYFAPTKAEYNALYIGNEIDARTITFVAETGEIWKNGVLYGKMSEADLKNMIQKITEENPYILPIATKDDADNAHIGGVMGGKYITVNTKNGSISIDINKLFSDPEVKNIITQQIIHDYVENEYVPDKASYDDWGVVKVLRRGGIAVENGVISIDGSNLPDSIKGKDGKDGSTPTIGTDGYWYIDGRNTGVKAKGEKGDKGDPGKDGMGGGGGSVKALVSITKFYLAYASDEGVTISTPGWTRTYQSLTLAKPYEWCYEDYLYNDNSHSYVDPYIIGSLGQKGEPGLDGGVDTTSIWDQINENKEIIHDIINGERERLGDLIDLIDEEIQGRVDEMQITAEWIQEHVLLGAIGSWSNFGEDGVKEYLQRMGLWDVDQQGNVVTNWSQIRQTITSIEQDVNLLKANPNGTTVAVQAAFKQWIEGETAQSVLDNVYAKTNDLKQVIEWMYSGLRSAAGPNMSYADILSAAKNKDHSAIADLHTAIEKLTDKYGNDYYISKASLIADVDDALAGVLGQTDGIYTLESLFSSVNADSNGPDGSLGKRIADLESQVSAITQNSDPNDPSSYFNVYSEAYMMADATVYEVDMEWKEVNGKKMLLPRTVEDSEGNKHFVYVQDTDENNNLLWTLTEDVTYLGEEYKKGETVTFNPGSSGVIKKKVKASNGAGFVSHADLDTAMAAMFAEDRQSKVKAKVEAIVSNGQSIVNIDANQINLNGQTNFVNAIGLELTANNIFATKAEFDELTSGNGTFTGNVKAKQFVAGDEEGTNITVTDKAICFNYQDDTRAWFSAYDATGTNVTQGMNLYIRDPQDHDNVITIDFLNLTFKAVNGNSTDVALPLYSLRNITNSSPINTTQTLYYSSSTGKYYTTPAGTLLATIGGGYYKQDGGKLVLIKDTSNVYRLVSADVYTPVDVTNGVLTEGSSSGIRVVIYTQSGLKYYTNDNTGTNTIQSENIKMNWSDANINTVTGYTSTQNEFQDVYVLHLSSNSGNTNTAAGNYTLFDEDSSNHAFVLAA